MPHQKTGAAFLAARGFALLADDAGAGKTAQVVTAADLAGVRRGLVFCPAVVRAHWVREFMRWQSADRPVQLVPGRVREIPGDGITVVSHACASDPESMSRLRAGAPYDLIAVDESSEYRQYNAARTRAMMAPLGAAALAPGELPGAWTWASRFWCLSGTPMVNSAADFWPLFYGPLGYNVTWWDFCQHFAGEMRPDDGGYRPLGLKNGRELADLLRSHALRRTLDSVGIYLPPLETFSRSVKIEPAALNVAMENLRGWTPDRLRAVLADKDEVGDSALASARRALGLAKIPAIAAAAHDIVVSGKGPVVVFFQHTDVRKGLYDILSTHCGHAVSWIDGTITRGQLGAAEGWFQAGKIDILLVQTQAGGMGLTLTRASRVIVAELPWTAVALYQAIKRVHRYTQTKPVAATIVKADGCWLEDVLASTVGRKHRAAEELLAMLTSNC